MTWPALTAREIRALAPDAVAAFDAVFAAVGRAADPYLVELARRRVATLVGGAGDELAPVAVLPEPQAIALSDWPSSPDFSAADRTCLGFAEQFVLDVGATTDADRAALNAALGRSAFGFVQALYVVDHGLRLVSVSRQLFGASPFRTEVGAAGRDLWPALETMMTAVVRLDALDPLTSELVRLRGASAHNCRVCQSRRHITAVVAPGADSLEQVNDYEIGEMGEAQRVALRLTDAILWQPTAISAELIGQVRDQFSPAAALEIVLDVVRNASNKIAVALGADQPSVTSGVEYYDVTATGDYLYGLPPPTR